jgi:sec-independent protein translocase protein TatA
MFGLGGQEIVVIAIVAVVLLFAAPRLPGLGHSMGQSIRGFKKGLKEDPAAEVEEKPGKDAETKPAAPDTDADGDESDTPTS